MGEETFYQNHYSHAEALAEAMLFASGNIIDIEDISVVLKLKNSETEEVMNRLAKRYDENSCGIVLRRIENGYQLCSRPELHDEIKTYFETTVSTALSRAALETLTIIAYNQPITRGNIEIIRGVNSDSVLSTLLERGLICEKGRSDSPGRPVLFGTTSLFLQSTGLSSLEDLKNFDPGISAEEEPTEEADPKDYPQND